MKAIRLCLIICFLLMSVSCSLKTNWDLVGKWEKVDGNETLEFTRDNLIKLTGPGVSVTCGYKFTDPKHMQVEVGSLATFVMKVSVSGGTLSLTDSSGKATKYQKAK